MTQLRDDCFAPGEERMKAEDALKLLAERVRPVVGAEEVALSEAHGRFLAAGVVSDRDVPGFDNSAVDGYAFAFADLAAEGETRLPVTERAAAGHPAAKALEPGGAVRIFTGAVVPEGADTVVMEEDIALKGDRVVIPPGIARGVNYRKAGEDIQKGSVVLERGLRLRPQDIGVAASLGRASLTVGERLRAALFSTGDELREPGQPLPDGGVYDSNRYMLAAMLRNMGCELSDLGILPDTETAVRDAIADAAGYPERSQGLHDRLGALDRAGGAVKGREKPVPCRVHLFATKTCKLAPDCRMMNLKEVCEAQIPFCDG